MGFNINTSKGRCRPAGPWLPPVQVSAMLQPGPHCPLLPTAAGAEVLPGSPLAGGDKDHRLPSAFCVSSTYSPGFWGDRKMSQQIKHIFSKSWMEVCDSPGKTQSTSLMLQQHHGRDGRESPWPGGHEKASTSDPLLRSVGGSGGQASQGGPPVASGSPLVFRARPQRGVSPQSQAGE